MKKTLAMILILAMSLALAACGAAATTTAAEPTATPVAEATAAAESTQDTAATTAEAAPEYDALNVVVADIYNETTSQGQALDAFKEYVERESAGKITVDIYHGGELGNEAETAAALKEGSVDMCFSGTAGIGQYIPALAVFECFYAFENVEQMQKAVTDLYDDLDASMMSNGFKLIGCYYDGPRQILSNVKITCLADLKGVKLRAPGSSIYVNSITALGANAISMPLGDVYTSLQTGAIDAYEGTFDLMVNQSFYEQGKYVIMDSHVYQPLFVNYNLDKWNALSPETQALFSAAMEYSEQVQMEKYRAGLEEYKQVLVDANLTFLELTDRPAWAAAVADASADYAASYGDLGELIYAKIQEIQAS